MGMDSPEMREKEREQVTHRSDLWRASNDPITLHTFATWTIILITYALLCILPRNMHSYAYTVCWLFKAVIDGIPASIWSVTRHNGNLAWL
eukprot:7171070-Pyramimonas_sp.AAC.2